jgi:hypothetical protein
MLTHMSEMFVYIPVPAEFAPEIYRRLAELSGPSLDEPGRRRAASGSSQDRPSPQELSEKLIERMYLESEPRHRELLEFLAHHADTWFTTKELADALGMASARALAGTLGAFGRRAKHRYGSALPWESVWDSRDELARHRMPGVVARRILWAAGEADVELG